MAGSSHLKADFNVYLDGTKLDGETKASISGVRVYLTHTGASAFEIVVDDPVLRWQAKPTFTECKEVKIELGIPGKMKKVFDGEVTAWRTELERSGPTVLVLRGMDRSHRLMRGHKTKTYAQASPIDCAQKIASAAGLTAKTSAGQPAPVKTYRIQANESDFNFLRKMADLEGYLFYVDGSDLHFERPTISSNDDVTVTYGEDLKTFLPVANFRRPAAKVEVGAWDSAGKAALTGKAKPGDELWSVPGGKPGADVAAFQGTKASVGIVESQVATQEHADTVAKAALTKRSLEFLTAEVEVQGNPEIKPGAVINVKKVGVYSGHYLVTEANHFFDAGGYNCIFYVARDKWGDSSTEAEKKRSKSDEKKRAKELAEKPYKPPKPPPGKTPPDDTIDFTLEGDDGKPLANVKCKIKLKSGEVIEATTDGDGHVHIDRKPEGPYTVEITGDALELTSIDVAVEDAGGGPVVGASGKVTLSDGAEFAVATDADGKIHLEDVPKGEYTVTFDASPEGEAAPEGEGEAEGGAAASSAGEGGAAGGGGAAAGSAEGGAAGGGEAAAAGGDQEGAAGGGEAAAAGGDQEGAAGGGEAAGGGAEGAAGGGEAAPAGGGQGGGAAGGKAAPGNGDAAALGAAPASGSAPGPGPGQGASASAGAGKPGTTGTGSASSGSAAPGHGAQPSIGAGAKPVPGSASGGSTAPTHGAPTHGASPSAGAGAKPGTTAPGGASAGGPGPGQVASPSAGAGKPGTTVPGAGTSAGSAAPSQGASPSIGAGAKPIPAGSGPGGAPPSEGVPSATGAGARPATTAPGGGSAGDAAPGQGASQSGGAGVSLPTGAGGAPAATADQAAPASPTSGTTTAPPPTTPATATMPDVAAAGLAPSEAIGGPSTPTGAPTLSVPGSSAPSLQAQGVPADEASAIGSAAAAVGSVAAGVASAARSTEAVKDAAKSAASKAKVPDSDNVEE